LTTPRLEYRVAKRINRVSDLPEWYALEKYQAASRLGSLGWYWQLAARIEIQKLVMYYDEFSKFPDNENIRQLFAISKDLLDEIRRRPIFDAMAPEVAQRFIGQNLPLPIGSGVRYFRDDLDSHLSELQGSHLQPSPTLDMAVALTLSNQIALTVSLDVPEKLLIENFIALIREAKAARANDETPPTRFRKPDFTEWVRLGVLPYLDLTMWAQQEKVTIPNRVMADALFPGGEAGEEVVRKTTEKLAGQLLNSDILNTLAVSHTIESTGQGV
jgi:hypothetical protein